MTARRIAISLALVLSLGLVGSASAYVPPEDEAASPVTVVTDPVTDPVYPSVLTDPITFVLTDPVTFSPDPTPGNALNEAEQAPAVETSGTGLVGTYVGTGPVRYIPAFQYQLLYSDPQGGYSCTAYATAMAVDKATYGGSRVTGRQIRALSGVPGYTGMSIPDLIRATDRLYVPISNMASSGTWTNVMAALRVGRGVILQGTYSTIPAAYSGQLSFKGNHAIFIDHLSSNGYLYMMDPLQKVGARWVPEKVMRDFVEKLARTKGIYPHVFYAVTRPVRLFR